VNDLWSKRSKFNFACIEWENKTNKKHEDSSDHHIWRPGKLAFAYNSNDYNVRLS